eukprot:1540250-Rhodomonas_salina.1
MVQRDTVSAQHITRSFSTGQRMAQPRSVPHQHRAGQYRTSRSTCLAWYRDAVPGVVGGGPSWGGGRERRAGSSIAEFSTGQRKAHA